MTPAIPIDFVASHRYAYIGVLRMPDRCVPHLRPVRGGDGVPVDTLVGICGATLGAFDNQRTISLLEEAVLSNMVLRRQLAELQAAHSMLQHENELREEFTSMAAHELRTPLNTLYLQTQMRRRAAPGAAHSAERDEAMVQRDERMIGNMVRLIDDMRDAARIQHGQMAISPQPMDLALMVARVSHGFEAQAATAGCELSFTAPSCLQGTWDEFRLEQVLGNLLTNAIRYGPGKPIQVRLERQSRQAVLSVSDGGRGIARADCARIFERFERAGDAGSTPGLGLGLYISRQIAREHGGSISVRSELGQGSVFELQLPLAA